MNPTTNFSPLPWEGKGEAQLATNVAKNAKKLASEISGQRFLRLSSKSELRCLLHSVFPHVSRTIDLLVLHCSDTRPSQQFTIEKLMACHKARGFGEYAGYHFYCRRDGTLYYCRPLNVKGCHVAGHNAHSIGICYEGGHKDPPQPSIRAEGGNPPPLGGDKRGASPYEDNRTAAQKEALLELLKVLKGLWPEARICSHRDLPGVAKACPCFDASTEYC